MRHLTAVLMAVVLPTVAGCTSSESESTSTMATASYVTPAAEALEQELAQVTTELEALEHELAQVTTERDSLAAQLEPESSVSEESSTTPTPAEPIERGLSVFEVGNDDCELYPMAVPQTETRLEDGTIEWRDGKFVCAATSNDPRVAGTVYYTTNQNGWGTGAANGSLVQWGTIRIENDRGAWEADYLGVYTSETGRVRRSHPGHG